MKDNRAAVPDAALDPVALRTLAAAVRAGTFDAAARELHVTPSAVSQRVKALERRVGRVLLHRTKPIEPTPAGHVLVRLAAQVDLLEREAVAELVGGEVGEAGSGDDAPWAEIPLAVNADTMATWMLDAMVAVQERHRVTFELFRIDETLSGQRLRHGDVMAAVTSVPQPVPGCRVVRLGTMRYLGLATPAYVERYLPDGPTAAALARAPLIDFDRADVIQRGFLRKLARRHLTPPATYVPAVRDYDEAVRRGMGWGMLVDAQARDDVAAGKLVEIAPGRHVDVPLFWQHWKLGSALMDDLTSAVVASAAEWLAPV
ncbi:MAG TPA: LysR family transcriptional regulator ArgP [Nocardioides sp.]|nr:LysR family transcriptional regulator ArgP [Nocardioides sp.]